MRTLTEADFLELWETGRSLHPLDQGILAVQAAFPEVKESVADWPIGRRNEALAKLRCASLGAALRGWAACRQCSEQLEFEVNGSNLVESPVRDRATSVMVWGRSYRLPTSRDLAAVVDESDTNTAARRLLEQCCADPSAERVWSEEEIEAVGESMSQADPLAEIRLSFDCPNCGAHFEESLDLLSFLWSEIEGRVKRLLLDVHTLASAYGWTEAAILALSPARREFYLKMVRT